MANINKRLESLSDLSGETINGQFEVIRLTAHRKYQTKCLRCGTTAEGVKHNDLLTNPRCFNPGCGVPAPTTAKSFRAEEQAAFTKLEEEYKHSANQLARLTCENLRRLPDPEFMPSRDLRVFLAMPHLLDDPRKFTEEQLSLFLDRHPIDTEDADSTKALTDYLLANGIGIPCDLETFDRAYCRLFPLGMVRVKRHAPPPEPKLVRKAATEKSANTKPLMTRGVDRATGLPRDYSEREIAQMSSEEYRRSFFTTASGLSKRALNLVDVLQGRLRA